MQANAFPACSADIGDCAQLSVCFGWAVVIDLDRDKLVLLVTAFPYSKLGFPLLASSFARCRVFQMASNGGAHKP